MDTGSNKKYMKYKKARQQRCLAFRRLLEKARCGLQKRRLEDMIEKKSGILKRIRQGE